MLNRTFIQAQIVLVVLLLSGCKKPTPVQVSEHVESDFTALYSYPDIYAEIGLKEKESDLDSCGLDFLDKSTGDRFIHLLDESGNYCSESINELKELIKTTKGPNIFVFLENITWGNQFGIFKGISLPEIRDGRYNESNFWTDVEPIFKNCGKQVYFWSNTSGDLPDDDLYLYQDYANIHIVAFGANSKEDCSMMTTRYDSGEIGFEVKLQDNDTLFDLKTFTLPFARSYRTKLQPSNN